jgi:6,7-dimethyl-8-ribityllumazine synthase
MRHDIAPPVDLPPAAGMAFALVISRFNRDVTARLRAGAEDALREAAASRVEVFDVPGAFELPLAAKAAAATRRFDAVVCLGCLVRGETPHFDYISSAVSHGIAEVSLQTGVPIAFGVLTVDTLAQAESRALPDRTNKGFEAAAAAIEMVHLMRRFAAAATPPLKA